MTQPIAVIDLNTWKSNMKMQRYRVTIGMDFDFCDMPDEIEGVKEDDIFKDAASELARSHYNDGRFPFEEEMLQRGLQELIQRAIFDSAMKPLMKYINQIVETQPGYKANLAYSKRDELMRNFRVYANDVIQTATIEIAPRKT